MMRMGFETTSWMRVAVLVIFCCFLSPTGALVTDPSEVDALGIIKSSLNDPMDNLKSWNEGDPCKSRWKGVECFNESAEDGYVHIRELQLLNLNISGSLSPAISHLSHLEILDFMWNNIQGSIPKEIGSLRSLKLLLLSGNKLSGSLPDELGFLSKLDRLQVDENHISGPLPMSFANLINVKHLHMNNNSISGQIPPELATLPRLVHFLLDNNNLSGHLPLAFSETESLVILQLDNNNFSGSLIPQSYGKIKSLIKLSLRNCSLVGTVPDFSQIPELTYLDLSWNQLEGPIPLTELSTNITTIDLSNNKLNGSIPPSYSRFPVLQKLSLRNNLFSGFFPSIWGNMTFGGNRSLILDFRNNFLSDFSGSLHPPPSVTLMLNGNPICSDMKQTDATIFCGSIIKQSSPGIFAAPQNVCLPQSCPKEEFFEYIPASPIPCYCAAPIRIGYRLKSPGFSDFRPYGKLFEVLAHDVGLLPYQIYIDSLAWEEGPRLRMYLKIFPNLSPVFNDSEVYRIRDLFAEWKIRNLDIFGPYELLNFTLLGPYSHIDLICSQDSHKGTMHTLILVITASAIVFAVFLVLMFTMMQWQCRYITFKRHSLSISGIKVDGMKAFHFEEMSHATNNFSSDSLIGEGGYGKVYKGILSDGTVVAVKRAGKSSMQCSKEFCNEIEFLSRLHHRNLVSLLGYCDEESEQMLIYEYMPNGTLRDHLSGKSSIFLDFPARLQIALGSARGILYLHNEANPPIFHRDIKASNILLDCNLTAKISDFGLSRFAPIPDIDGEVNGHISTVVKGTPGYIDPEYFLTHKLTDKSDIYSLGVVFLELLTGMHPISHGRNIVRETRVASRRSQISSIIDKRMKSYPRVSAERFMLLALRCCDEDTDIRPSMREVVRELEDICMTIVVNTSSLELAPTESSEIHSESSISGDSHNSSCQSDAQTQNISITYTR